MEVFPNEVEQRMLEVRSRFDRSSLVEGYITSNLGSVDLRL